MSDKCLCNSDLEFEKCCEPFLLNKATPNTAKELMRSRYTAFAIADINYIKETRHPRSQNKFNVTSTTKWAKESKWLGLEILNCKAGEKDDLFGEVEFIAKYTTDGEKQDHHETAKFQQINGKWLFVDGDFILPETFSRATVKVGRNDLCPCKSGKKFKKCCGK